MIPYGRQDISEEDIAAVVKVLRSEFLTQGTAVPAFERALADCCGAGHAVAVSSGTAALHIACIALGLGPGDWLWTSAITFVASANCARYCGANVDFVDIDPRTYNMSVAALATKLTEAERVGRLPKVVIPVHFAGQSCDMREVRALADKYGFKIIEDASHAVGGGYAGERVGCCRYSDMAVFSFHPVKVITTGEGGMVLTNAQDIAGRLERLRSHGITRDASMMDGKADGAWYYQQTELGYNYRMTDLQAALGHSQLGRLEAFLVSRRGLAARYGRILAGLPVTLPWQHPDATSAWHLYVVQVDEVASGRTREEVFNSLRASGVGVNVHYIPVHLQPFYRDRKPDKNRFPVSEAYYRRAITLPLYAALTEEDQDRVAAALAAALA